MILTDAEAARYRRQTNRGLMLFVALEVRNEHRGGRLCRECPPPRSGLRCPKLATWLPIFSEMGQP